MAALGEDEAQLARQIKHFRKHFRQEHGRDPSRKDMARQPEIAAVYKAWLACKGVTEDGQSSKQTPSQQASTSTLKPAGTASSTGKARDVSSRSDDKHAPKQRQKRSLFAEDMPAPPSTPGRKKHAQREQHRQSLMSTPQRTPTRSAEIKAAIEDSGGSVIDVPMTPQQQQKKKRRGRVEGAMSPSSSRALGRESLLQPGPSQGDARFRELAPTDHDAGMEYDDATSPSKLRALIASFTATRSRLTPTKMKAATHRAARFADEEEHDSEDSSSEAEASGSQGASLKSRLQASRMAYTPRTKARKRLRGEVIVTPGKTPKRADDGMRPEIDEAATPSKPWPAQRKDDAQPPAAKRQRGMGSLKSFGFTAVREGVEASQGKSRPSLVPSASSGDVARASSSSLDEAVFDEAENFDVDDDDDDDDEIMGPSPSVRKIADMSATIFQPLLGVEREIAHEEDDAQPELIEPAKGDAEHKDAEQDKATEDDSSDNELDFVRAYEPYSQSSQRRPKARDLGEDGEGDEPLGLPFAAPLGNRHELQMTQNAISNIDEEDQGMLSDDEPASAMFGGLSLASPQCKRARQAERLRAAQKVRALLALDDNAVQAAKDEAEQAANDTNDLSKRANVLAATERARTTAKMLSAPRKRGVHAGRAKAALAAEAAEQGAAAEGDPSALLGAPANKPRLIMRRGREDDYDSDDDGALDADTSLLFSDDEEADAERPKARARAQADIDASDDDWASDVGSDEYGLGDGLMDEYDVA